MPVISYSAAKDAGKQLSELLQKVDDPIVAALDGRWGAAENPVAEIVVLVEAGDVAALKTHPIKPYSSSPKAIARYRDLAVMAIEAGSDNQSIWIFPATG
ncbi:hypothetical protein [Mesorhizobium koreense]|uniref:hypothetical protein n=1 Tax=Mesorhizobium koreense TaxID=3074855 RepID=UPI00287B685D|nr:hypothetical protein [Mesorhizobium sp. WR6]